MPTSQAIRIYKNGGPEELRFETIEVGHPGGGQVLLRHTAIGLNFTDIHHRTGRYPGGGFPLIIGMEAAGRVEEVGDGVTEFKPGDRVAYGGATPSRSPGSYCQFRVIDAKWLVRIPEWIDDQTAAALYLKGLTAEYLLHGTYPVKAGDSIVVHAAAGGVGLIMCQWASHKGATVIGTVSTPDKVDLARANGCAHVIVNSQEDVAGRVRELTGGVGVTVVYDSVGAATFEASLASVKRRGLVVSFGSASGPVPPVDIFRLNRMGSLYLTGAGFADYTRERPELLARAKNLFDAVKRGDVRVQIHQRYPLEEAQRAHRDLEARRTIGSSVILP